MVQEEHHPSLSLNVVQNEVCRKIPWPECLFIFALNNNNRTFQNIIEFKDRG